MEEEYNFELAGIRRENATEALKKFAKAGLKLAAINDNTKLMYIASFKLAITLEDQINAIKAFMNSPHDK